jgi:hypothetical protein
MANEASSPGWPSHEQLEDHREKVRAVRVQLEAALRVTEERTAELLATAERAVRAEDQTAALRDALAELAALLNQAGVELTDPRPPW